MSDDKFKNFRSRNFLLLLYPDDETHANAIQQIRKGYIHAMILHDNDVWSESDENLGEHEVGSKKKEHWHVVIHFDNQVWRNALAKDLGISPQYIEATKGLKSALQYLIHYGFKDKQQYDVELVTGELKEDLLVYLSNDNRNEVQQVNMIFDYIWRHEGLISMSTLTTFAIESNCWASFRRNYRIISDIVQEKNSFYRKFI